MCCQVVWAAVEAVEAVVVAEGWEVAEAGGTIRAGQAAAPACGW